MGRLGQPPGVECLSKLTLTHKMPANVRQCRYDMAGQSGLSGTWMTLNQGWISVHFLSQNYSSCARLYPVEKNGLFQAGLRDRRSQGLGVSSARRLAACWNTSISDGYCSIPQSSVWVSCLTTQIPFSHNNPHHYLILFSLMKTKFSRHQLVDLLCCLDIPETHRTPRRGKANLGPDNGAQGTESWMCPRVKLNAPGVLQASLERDAKL